MRGSDLVHVTHCHFGILQSSSTLWNRVVMTGAQFKCQRSGKDHICFNYFGCKMACGSAHLRICSAWDILSTECLPRFKRKVWILTQVFSLFVGIKQVWHITKELFLSPTGSNQSCWRHKHTVSLWGSWDIGRACVGALAGRWYTSWKKFTLIFKQDSLLSDMFHEPICPFLIKYIFK